MLAITAQCPYTFGPALPTNFSKKGLILLSNLGPNPPSLIYFKFNKYILHSTYRQELQILPRLTYCIPCKHKITTFINILVINIHYDQGQSNFVGGYFFLSTHCTLIGFGSFKRSMYNTMFLDYMINVTTHMHSKLIVIAFCVSMFLLEYLNLNRLQLNLFLKCVVFQQNLLSINN